MPFPTPLFRGVFTSQAALYNFQSVIEYLIAHTHQPFPLQPSVKDLLAETVA